MFRSITGRKAIAALVLVRAGSSAREKEPCLSVTVPVPDRMRSGTVDQNSATSGFNLGRYTARNHFSPVPREILWISFVCSSWTLFPDHRAAADGGWDVAVHHDNVVVVVIDVIAPDITYNA